MEIYHRVGFNTNKNIEFISELERLDFLFKVSELPGGTNSVVVFEITESDARWGVVAEFIANNSASNIIETLFTNEEILAAKWLRLISTFEQGYPQPKPNWPIKQLSYDILCEKCCTYRQTNSMRLAKEPNLGRKSFMSLIWAGEVFCTPEVFQGLEKISAAGYEAKDAVIHKTGIPSKKVMQLFIPDVAASGLIVNDDLERKICPVCGTTKYYPHVKGKMYLKSDALLIDTDFILTSEWFGHGLLAWREVLVSNRVARLIIDEGWEGVRLKVVELA